MPLDITSHKEYSMADSLADRLKRMVAEDAQGEAAQAEQTSFQARVDAYISLHAREEYDALRARVSKRAEELNPDIGDLPKFELVGDAVKQDNCVASFMFDKPITNMPQNQLFITIGPHPYAMYFHTAPPEPRRFRLRAAATDDINGIVWVGDLGEVTSAQLTEVIFESLTSYYLKNKPRPFA